MKAKCYFDRRRKFGRIRSESKMERCPRYIGASLRSFMYQSKGFVVISTVLVLLAVALSLGTTVTLLSIGDAQTSYSLSEGASSRLLLDGCVEDMLLFARASASYAGGTITRPEGSCDVALAKAGSRWTAMVQTRGEYVHTADVIFDRNSSGIKLVSWHAIP